VTVGWSKLGAELLGQRQAGLHRRWGRDHGRHMPAGLCAKHTDLAVVMCFAISMGMSSLDSNESEETKGRYCEGQPLHQSMVHNKFQSAKFLTSTIILGNECQKSIKFVICSRDRRFSQILECGFTEDRSAHP
jgi:hypothetical protein